jgi:hypothetical protein
MQARQADRCATVGDDVEHTRGGHGAVAADPQVGQASVGMAGSHTQVAIQREGCLAAVGKHARPPALAEDGDHLVVQVEILQHDPGTLAPA